MRDGELIDWYTRCFKEKWTMHKQKIIEHYIKKLARMHSVTHIAMRISKPCYSCPIKRIISRIKDFSRRNSIVWNTYCIDDLKKFFSEDMLPNRKELYTCIIAKHPVLAQLFAAETRNANNYYARLFEAVAVGMMCHKAIEQLST
jgi:hypothetical protein